ncbi:Adhesion G protein-coupled receptor F5 [Dissostichus eleginoides]|uniref:Adhesion G protein-coupled receptor F5 n=1 Tax=Dissostichus eleginoides TaxID=100907 RepID=A0AAD9F4F8_DISEL|nr:Adhesion G protein-coupled receptor F5 [Dissostichus eleginoides]
MTVQLNKAFKDTLNDPQSAAYNDLKNTMNEVLINKYEGITGFIGVSVTGFREGSIFTDFVVETTEVKTAELAKANKEFSEAVNSTIAPVIGSVTAFYNSEDELGFTAPIYTGNSMTLVCKPRNINVGQISSVEWTLRGRELQVKDVSDFVEDLSKDVKEVKKEVRESPNTISTIVEILGNIADFPTLVVDQPVIESVLQTVDVIIGDDSRESWTVLNANENNNASSDLLGSMELLSDKIVGTFTFETDAILLTRSTFDDSFYANLNSSIVLDIPNTGFPNATITTITFYTLNNVMPVRNTSLFNTNSNNTDPVNALNAAVVLIKVNEKIRNVTLSYAKLNTTLKQDPQCVFWNFKLFDNRGAWDRVGTMLDSSNRGLHIVFALFNSLQGFFILVFGTLFDSKISSILARKSPTTSTGSNTTRSTSGGISSTGLNWFHRLHVYRVSETANSGSAGASESFSNI